jgi:hypothetical protein
MVVAVTIAGKNSELNTVMSCRQQQMTAFGVIMSPRHLKIG